VGRAAAARVDRDRLTVELLVALLKAYARLSSPTFILTVFGIGVLLVFSRRFAHWGRRWLVCALLAYWFASTPVGSTIVAAPLTVGQHRIESPTEAVGAQAIVVLSGGTRHIFSGDYVLDELEGSALRVIEGARLYQLLGGPLVIVSGGSVGVKPRPRPEANAMQAAMLTLGVPASKVLVEDRSQNTHDQAVILRTLLAERHIDRFVLVTSPTHLGRSVAAFRNAGMNPIGAASPLRSDSTRSFWTPIPDWDSLAISDMAVYDAVAWLYYWQRGWLGAPTRKN
jgi:uncharacterized SAM-binding protein YcdF (DUF218 family)